MVLFQEFISDPKTSSFTEDINQKGLHQENTWPMTNVLRHDVLTYWYMKLRF
jgi:hypothetical protein